MLYPYYPLPDTPITITTNVDLTKTENTFSQVYYRWNSFRVKRFIELNYSYLNESDIDDLYNFYMKLVKNKYNVFNYTTHIKRNWYNEYIGKVETLDVDDGVIFSTPIYNTFKNICVNGEVLSNDKFDVYYDLSISERKLIRIDTTAVNVGDLITVDIENDSITLVCAFDEMSIGIQHLAGRLSSIKSLRLEEVLNINYYKQIIRS